MLRVRAIKCFYWDWMLCRVRVRASNKIKQIKIQIAIRTLPRSIRLSSLHSNGPGWPVNLKRAKTPLEFLVEIEFG